MASLYDTSRCSTRGSSRSLHKLLLMLLLPLLLHMVPLLAMLPSPPDRNTSSG
jgi:hypothetical protein